MTALAVAIVICTVLVLVDRNQKWKVFWRILRDLFVLTVLTVIGAFVWSEYGYSQNGAWISVGAVIGAFLLYVLICILGKLAMAAIIGVFGGFDSSPASKNP